MMEREWTRDQILDELHICYSSLHKYLKALGMLPNRSVKSNGFVIYFYSCAQFEELREYVHQVRPVRSAVKKELSPRMASPYKKGQWAFEEGKTILDNPFSVGDAFWRWYHGYMDAKSKRYENQNFL